MADEKKKTENIPNSESKSPVKHEVLLSMMEDLEEEKKKAQESEEKFRSLYESSRDAIMTLEPPTWKFTSGNPATVKMFGAKDEKEFVSKGPGDLSPEKQPDGQLSSEKAPKMIMKAMKEASNFFEWTHKRLKGEEFPATVLLTRFKLKGKDVLQATVRDITEEKKAEEKIKESERKFRNVFDYSQENFLLIDSNKKIFNANDTAIKTLGYSKKSILGKNILDLHFKKDVTRCIKNIKSALSGKLGVCDCAYICSNKKVVLTNAFLSPMQVSGKACILISFRDMTEQKKAEEQIENTFNLSPDMMGVFTTEGKLLKVNPSWERILGYTSEELLKMDWTKLIHPDDVEPTNKTVAEQLKGSPVANFINRYKHKDGSYRTLEWQASPAKESNIVYATARDITEQKKVQEKLKQEHEFSQTILDTIPYGMDIVDENLRIVHMNKAFLGIFGEKAIGKKCFQIHKDNKKQCEKCPLKKPIKVGDTQTIITHGVAGGKTFKITHTGFKLSDGKKAILEFFDDITHVCKRHKDVVQPTNQKKYEKATVDFFHKYKDMPTKEELEEVFRNA